MSGPFLQKEFVIVLCAISQHVKAFERRAIMSIELYAFFSYLFTAAISLFLMGVVVLLNKLMGSKDNNVEGGDV